ncbi:MAG: hypothetical protein KAF91_07660 [Nostoc sp. TH1S01]|nr:hypothetical protein [Nostoc sp. TH1S01]
MRAFLCVFASTLLLTETLREREAATASMRETKNIYARGLSVGCVKATRNAPNDIGALRLDMICPNSQILTQP